MSKVGAIYQRLDRIFRKSKRELEFHSSIGKLQSPIQKCVLIKRTSNTVSIVAKNQIISLFRIFSPRVCPSTPTL